LIYRKPSAKVKRCVRPPPIILSAMDIPASVNRTKKERTRKKARMLFLIIGVPPEGRSQICEKFFEIWFAGELVYSTIPL
jgi:hypothetical protein